MKDEKKPTPAWLSPGGDRGARTKHSRRSEQALAKRFGGRSIKRSGGARWSADDKNTDRGDVSLPGFHVEHKETEAESLGVKREWLEKVRAGAVMVLKDPALVIKFVRRPPRSDEEYVVLPVEVFERLLRACGKLSGQSSGPSTGTTTSEATTS